MAPAGKILVTRERIVAAGGVKPALDEAHALASLRMTPLAMTAYEAVGSTPTEADGAAVLVQIEVNSEQELRQALDAGAQAVLLAEMSLEKARRLTEIAQSLHADCLIEVRPGDSRNTA